MTLLIYSKNPLQRRDGSLTLGFTLVELLIVMSIMGLILSLVGPLALNMIDKAQAQSEFISFKNNLKKISYISFASATEHSVTLDVQTISILKADESIQQSQFKYLQFPSQKITFNSRGYPFPESINVSFNNKIETINVFKLVEGVDEKHNQ
jgi:prepilin-type N-terminal cleavage/methylation domain-containing protein